MNFERYFVSILNEIKFESNFQSSNLIFSCLVSFQYSPHNEINWISKNLDYFIFFGIVSYYPTWRECHYYSMWRERGAWSSEIQVFKQYLHRAFNFDQHDAFVVDGDASSTGVATGGEISLITVVLPWFLVHRRPLGSLRQARHLIPEQHLQYWLKDLPQRANNFLLSLCFSLLDARTLQQNQATSLFIVLF